MGNTTGKTKKPIEDDIDRDKSNPVPDIADSNETNKDSSPVLENATPSISIPKPQAGESELQQMSVFGSPLESLVTPIEPPSFLHSTSPRDTETPDLTTQPHIFQYKDTEASTVALYGSFDDWGTRHVMDTVKDGVFQTILHINPGTYEYKFDVDGQWKHDPSRPISRTSYGSVNNFITIETGLKGPRDDHAIPTEPIHNRLVITSNDDDKLTTLSLSSLDENKPASSSRPDTPPGEYAQTIPDLRNAPPPPSLPPHLLQIPLNSHSINGDPTQLPEPNHVMLNHLYALSIKDGVMVLGTTHRYRQKYVTTVLYKPVSDS